MENRFVGRPGRLSESPEVKNMVLNNIIWQHLFKTRFWCYVGLNSCAKSRAPLCHAADCPVCLASTSEPDMFLGVALVCPAFLSLFEQTGVVVLSAGNDSDY